jgi:hypothetical protein
LAADEAREPGATLTGSPEALGKGLEMLARQQRRRHHHGHLNPGHGRDEGRAQRHLGLAEADIAADQPVHRPPRGRSSITRSIADLVFGLLIGEAGANSS